MRVEASSLAFWATSAGSVRPDNPRLRTAGTPGALMPVLDTKATEKSLAGCLRPPKAAELNLIRRNK
jgi:hypothetical protein